MAEQHYRVVIAYKGRDYFGWQYLGDAGEKPTVQFEILKVLRKISKYETCQVAGASRTDAGVHALGQVAKLTTPLQIAPDKLQRGMNSLLPRDIRMVACARCAPVFNPNREAVSKTYRYYFTIDALCAPLLGDLVAHVPLLSATATGDAGENRIQRMKAACDVFVGEHDFSSFSVRDVSGKSAIRTVASLELFKTPDAGFGEGVYCFEIKGNGFLKYMVRYIVGSLFEVGRQNIGAAAIQAALAQPQSEKLSAKAKAKGLHLIKIDYERPALQR